MKLTYVYAPVANLDEALAVYRDELGWEEAWREGETCVIFHLPGSDVLFMLDEDASKAGHGGPFFLVDDVASFLRDHGARLRTLAEPQPIPGGFWAGVADPAGNPLFLFDQSTDPTAPANKADSHA